MNAQYPEHEKLSKVSETSQAIGEFLESLNSKGIELASYGTGKIGLPHDNMLSTFSKGHPERLYPITTPTQTLLAEFFSIDLQALEEEKRRMLDTMINVGKPAVPDGFWAQIEHQLDRLITEKVKTFAEIREILLDPAYDQVQREIHRNGRRTFPDNAAFFAGSGGDRSVLGALSQIGWVRTWSQASYYYRLVHPETEEAIEYIEGDLYAIDSNATPGHL